MQPVLTCTQWDDATQTCTAQAWVEMPTVFGKLPSLQDAAQIGNSIMLGVGMVLAASLLILSAKGNDDE